jgi:tetratricopeptide (TPR) repeat protein
VSLQLVFLLWELKRNIDAKDLLFELSRLEPAGDQITLLLGIAYTRLNDVEHAIEMYRMLDKKSFYYLLGVVSQIRLLHASNQSDAAIGVFEDAVKDSIYSDDLFVLGATLYAERRDFDKSIGAVKKGVEIYPKNTRLLFLLGMYQERANHIDDSIVTMRQIIELDPLHSGALNYLGYVFAELNRNLDEALLLVKRALEVKPSDGYYLDSLGWVYFRMGQYENAVESLKQALVFAPDEGVIYHHLGEVYLKLNRIKDAVEFFEKALNCKIDEEERAEIEGKVHQWKQGGES